MKIKVLFHGILADWVGAQEAEFALREGSPIAELTAVIGLRFGRNMPEQLWDRDKNSFVKSVWAMRGDQKMMNPEEELKEGDVIKFLLMQAGG